MKRVFIAILPLLFALAVIGCGPATVADKKVVQISFKGTLGDGTVFGQSEAGKPLEFMVGAGKMIPALEKALIGLKVGDKKTVVIKAADAYGEWDKNAVQDVPKEEFSKDLELKVGQMYSVQTPQGQLTVKVTAIGPKMVTIDFNHPLAGKDLTFEVQVIKIRDATKEELAAVLAPTPAPTATPAPSK
jgi:FKBP-type peptidyl-prolyl cis-trans isomerase 2